MGLRQKAYPKSSHGAIKEKLRERNNKKKHKKKERREGEEEKKGNTEE